MRDNVKQFLQRLTEAIDLPLPVLEIGALQTEGQESYADVRPFFGDGHFVGCDMRQGHGVDCLADAHQLPFRDGSVGTVLLLDTLEHVQSPVVAVQEACRVLKRGGVVLLASVMNFPIHSHPSDYWRFTPAVFDYLLTPFAPRTVVSQGDAEFPQTVIGVAMKQPITAEEGERFREAVRTVTMRWPERASGGPLLVWQPSFIAVAQRLAEQRLPELKQGRTIAQSFICPENHLSRIDVKLSNLGRSNNCHVLFRLREQGGAQQEVAAYRLYAPHVIEEGWSFVPIPDQAQSAGRRYLLTLESPDGVFGQAVTAMASNGRAYRDGQLYVDGESLEGSLCFQVYCRAPDLAVSAAARGESPGGEGVPVGALPVGTATEQSNATDIAAALLRNEEQRWEQTRYLASAIRSALDAVGADYKVAQARIEVKLESGLQELAKVQQEALAESREAASLARAVKRNPLLRLLRRLLG
jgi:SAM-dependent methyltransferase